MIRIDYKRPCKTRNVSSDFEAHIKRGSNLPGIDYAMPVGEQIFATAGGRVVRAVRSSKTASGIHIVIRHADGRQSWYLHLSRILVGVGKRVKAGDVIARSGNTGRSTGPHLHFSIMDKSGKCVDPQKLIDRDKKPKVSEPVKDIAVDPAPKKPSGRTTKPKVIPE
jgi:murein DD-endopeptidase MepM/ murein hydrolase activator NlpD